MFDSSITGIRNSFALAETAAKNLSQMEAADPEDFANLIVAERSAQANIVALRTSLSMSDHLIDLLA
jgi:flagellar hook protein FlgE